MTTISSAASSILHAAFSPAAIGFWAGAAVTRSATVYETALVTDALEDTAFNCLLAAAGISTVGWLSTRPGNLFHSPPGSGSVDVTEPGSRSALKSDTETLLK